MGHDVPESHANFLWVGTPPARRCTRAGERGVLVRSFHAAAAGWRIGCASPSPAVRQRPAPRGGARVRVRFRLCAARRQAGASTRAPARAHPGKLAVILPRWRPWPGAPSRAWCACSTGARWRAASSTSARTRSTRWPRRPRRVATVPSPCGPTRRPPRRTPRARRSGRASAPFAARPTRRGASRAAPRRRLSTARRAATRSTSRSGASGRAARSPPVSPRRRASPRPAQRPWIRTDTRRLCCTRCRWRRAVAPPPRAAPWSPSPCATSDPCRPARAGRAGAPTGDADLAESAAPAARLSAGTCPTRARRRPRAGRDRRRLAPRRPGGRAPARHRGRLPAAELRCGRRRSAASSRARAGELGAGADPRDRRRAHCPGGGRRLAADEATVVRVLRELPSARDASLVAPRRWHFSSTPSSCSGASAPRRRAPSWRAPLGASALTGSSSASIGGSRRASERGPRALSRAASALGAARRRLARRLAPGFFNLAARTRRSVELVVALLDLEALPTVPPVAQEGSTCTLPTGMPRIS